MVQVINLNPGKALEKLNVLSYDISNINYQNSTMSGQTFWVIKKTQHAKFPFRLSIVRGKEKILDLFVQDSWPGTKGNIFCIRAEGRQHMGGEEQEIERVPVLNCSLYGKRITVILDRSTKKRCSFLFLVRGYKTKEGEYEQIFWQTQQGLTQRKSKYKLTYYGDKQLTVFVDSQERYAWNFPTAKTVKEKLPIGDYAIKDKFGFLAVVERKTFANFLNEFGNLKKFHQHLSELCAHKNSALVVEANFGDFLDKEKTKPYTGAFGAKAIAEIQAAHPKLPVVFAGSRKSAIVWTAKFFEAVNSKNGDFLSDAVRESSSRYGASKEIVFSEDEIRRTVFSQMPERFTSRMLCENLPEISKQKISANLKKMQKEGVLSPFKKGREIVWVKCSQ